MPKNLEGYYQETGRAGRDGLPADAWMCYGLGDVMNLRRLIAASPNRRAAAPHRAPQARGAARLLRDDRVPPSGPARLFRRARPAALRKLRQLPGPARDLGRQLAAQKALSAAYRTGERFGAHHLADVLVGKGPTA